MSQPLTVQVRFFRTATRGVLEQYFATRLEGAMVVEWRNGGGAQGSGRTGKSVSFTCARTIYRDEVNGVEAQSTQAIALELVPPAGEVPAGNPLDLAVGIVELSA